jgi:hypothetical protein
MAILDDILGNVLGTVGGVGDTVGGLLGGLGGIGAGGAVGADLGATVAASPSLGVDTDLLGLGGLSVDFSAPVLVGVSASADAAAEVGQGGLS